MAYFPSLRYALYCSGHHACKNYLSGGCDVFFVKGMALKKTSSVYWEKEIQTKALLRLLCFILLQ